MLLLPLSLAYMIAVLSGLILIFYAYGTATFNYWRSKGVFYLRPLPYLGNYWPVLTVQLAGGQLIEKVYRATNDKVAGLYIFRRPYLLIRDPELLKHVLVKDFKHFSNRTHKLTNPKDIIGNYHLFTMKNPHWKTMRSQLTPIFSSGKLKAFYPLMTEIGNRFNTFLKTSEQSVHEMKMMCGRYSADIIGSIAFGLEGNSFADKKFAEFHYVSSTIFDWNLLRTLELTSVIFSPFLTQLLNLQFFGTKATKYIRELFWSTVRYREENKIQRTDLIDLLIKLRDTGSVENGGLKSKIEEGSKIDFDGDVLVAQAAIFIAGAYESSSSTLASTLYHLANDPELQVRLRNEINDTFENTTGDITYEAISDMKYLDQCVKETLRLYPPINFLDRDCTEDYVFPGTNLKIEKGTAVVVSLHGLHRDPKYWNDPEIYDPERFSKENAQNILPYTYMPFGDGPHNCIGGRFGLLNVKVGLISILRGFAVELVNKPKTKRNTMLKLDPKGLLTSPKDPIHLKFKRISAK